VCLSNCHLQIAEKEIHCLQNLKLLRNQNSCFIQLKGSEPVEALDLIILVPHYHLQKAWLPHMSIYSATLFHLPNIIFYYLLLLIKFLLHLCKIHPETGESNWIQEPSEPIQDGAMSRFSLLFKTIKLLI
jgi:hypothetical protein